MKMRTKRILVSLPAAIRLELEQLRAQGYTVSGYLRGLVERDLHQRRMTGEMRTQRTQKGGAR